MEQNAPTHFILPAALVSRIVQILAAPVMRPMAHFAQIIGEIERDAKPAPDPDHKQAVVDPGKRANGEDATAGVTDGQMRGTLG